MIEVQLSGSSRAPSTGASRTGSIYLFDAFLARGKAHLSLLPFVLVPDLRSLTLPASTCNPDMPPVLCVSADIRRSPTNAQPDSQLSPSATRSTIQPWRFPPSGLGRPQLHAVTRDTPAWKLRENTTWAGAQSHSAGPLPPSQQATAVRLETSEKASTLLLEDQSVKILEAALQKQGCLSSAGKMSSPTHTRPAESLLPTQMAARALHSQGQSSSHDPFMPTT